MLYFFSFLFLQISNFEAAEIAAVQNKLNYPLND